MMTENRNAKTNRTQGRIEANRLPERTARSLGHRDERGSRDGRRTGKKAARPSVFRLGLAVVGVLLVGVSLTAVYSAF